MGSHADCRSLNPPFCAWSTKLWHDFAVCIVERQQGQLSRLLPLLLAFLILPLPCCGMAFIAQGPSTTWAALLGAPAASGSVSEADHAHPKGAVQTHH
eukprot:scaffold167359_cov13-Tisochrysis_lutea.AAC.1